MFRNGVLILGMIVMKMLLMMYENAPNDGTVWDEQSNQNCYQNYLDNIEALLNKNSVCVIRGGSWLLYPWSCRSAYRDAYYPRFDNNLIGFRVVCG